GRVPMPSWVFSFSRHRCQPGLSAASADPASVSRALGGGSVRAGEELGEYRCEHFGRHLVRLAREGLAFGVWERGRELRVGAVLVGLALAAVEYERGYLHGGPLPERGGAAAAAVRHRGGVVGQGVGDRFKGGPERFLAHLLDELARDAGGGGHEVGDRVAAPTRGNQLGQRGFVVG